MAANVENMFSVREVPWHGLGTIVQEAPTSEEALRLAGLDWEVMQKPVINRWEVEPGVIKEITSDYFMNVRSNDGSVLGCVGGRYKPVQNKDAFSFTDHLIGAGVTYETAGSLASGKRIWLLAKMPTAKILEDEVEPYMVLTNSHDGFGSLKVAMTPVRVVCQNTLNLAMSKAKRLWNVRHTGNIESKIDEAKHTLNLANGYMDQLATEAEELFSIKIAPKDFQLLSQQLFPITGEMSNRKIEAQDLLRDQLYGAYNMDDLGNIRGTGWGFMNAVSDMTTHRPPARKTDNYRENNFMATVDAPVVLDEALKILKGWAMK